MQTKEQIELTIRTATLIKSLTHLVGTVDAHLAWMMYCESIPQFTALGEFLEKQRAALRR